MAPGLPYSAGPRRRGAGDKASRELGTILPGPGAPEARERAGPSPGAKGGGPRVGGSGPESSQLSTHSRLRHHPLLTQCPLIISWFKSRRIGLWPSSTSIPATAQARVGLGQIAKTEAAGGFLWIRWATSLACASQALACSPTGVMTGPVNGAWLLASLTGIHSPRTGPRVTSVGLSAPEGSRTSLESSLHLCHH